MVVINQPIVLRYNTHGDWTLPLARRNSIDHIEVWINSNLSSVHRGHRERLSPKLGHVAENLCEAALHRRDYWKTEPASTTGRLGRTLVARRIRFRHSPHRQ